MMRLTNGIICGRDKLTRELDLVIRQDRIFLEAKNDRAAEETLNLNGSYILPGFTEIHTHGAALFDFTAGRYEPEKSSFQSNPAIYQEELPRYARLQASTGVTNFYPGTWAVPVKQLRFCFKQLKKYVDSEGNGKDGSFIRGGMLEGAFFNPQMCGAQNPNYALLPEKEKFDEMNESGLIKLVNIVPDYGEASCRLTRELTERGISVGAGHTNATADQFRAAIDQGLKYSIHFLNGPTGGSYKSFNHGGAIEAVLQDEHIYAELILDGFHVNPVYVREVLERKGLDRVITVTDAMFASQVTGIKDFQISGMSGRISEDGKYAYVVDKKPLTLFSSTLTMDVAFSNLLSFLTQEMKGIWQRRHQAMSLDQALLIAARLCATNANEMLKMHGGEDTQTGSVEEGKWADLIIADIKGNPGNYHLEIHKVFVRGRQMTLPAVGSGQ